MLCSILLSIVNKEMGKKVRFRHNKDHFPQISLKMGTLVRTKNIFIAISLVKLNHSHRKYSRKKFYRRIFLKCSAQITQMGMPLSSRYQDGHKPAVWPSLLRHSSARSCVFVSCSVSGSLCLETRRSAFSTRRDTKIFRAESPLFRVAQFFTRFFLPDASLPVPEAGLMVAPH